MKVLVACEESQRVCTAFRRLGHRAYSCDIVDCSGGHPEWHIKGDALRLLNGNCTFVTVGGVEVHIEGRWDMIIAHPPCTHLSSSGARHFETKREDGRQREGLEFFCKFLEADCDKVAIENPVGIISGNYVKKFFPDLAEKYNLPRKPTQIIHPWMFGDEITKATCLWITGMKPLVGWCDKKPEQDYFEWEDKKTSRTKRQVQWYYKALSLKPEERAKVRSRTFEGIAKAMAEQWGGDIRNSEIDGITSWK